MKRTIPTFAILALIGAAAPILTPTASAQNKITIIHTNATPIPTCPPSSCVVAPNTSGRTIVVGGG